MRPRPEGAIILVVEPLRGWTLLTKMIFLSWVALSSATLACAEEGCLQKALETLSSSEELANVATAFSKLPKPGSEKWQQFVQKVRERMDPKGGPGWVKLDLKEFLPESVFDDLFKICPAGTLCVAKDESSGKFHGFPDTRRLDKSATQSMRILADWVEALVKESLPEEYENPGEAAFRILSGGKGLRVDRWHPDAQSIIATIGLKGEGAEIMPKGSKGQLVKTNPGELLIFSGVDRHYLFKVPPTIHRTPPGEMDRILFLLRIPAKRPSATHH